MSLNKNILIYRLGSLGDTVIALPVFHRIIEVYPDITRITLLTNKPVAAKAAPLEAVLGKEHFFKDTLSYPVGTRNPVTIAKLVFEIKKRNIHTVINITANRSPEADKRDKLFFKTAGVKEFIGFDTKPDDYKVKIDPNTGFYEWETSRLARKIESLGKFDFNLEKYWDLKLTDKELVTANKLLEQLTSSKPIIAMNVGTKMPIKDWGIDNWTNFISQISKDFKTDFQMVIIGVDEEKQLGDQCLAAWNGEGINLCGKSSPRVSAAILKQAVLFIGHDSGPMHLAACVGTPCLAVFSCINQPKQWFPRGTNNYIVMPQTYCAQNGENSCSNPKKRCILTVQVEELKKGFDQLIREVVI